MAIQILGTAPRTVRGGQTGRQIAGGFASVTAQGGQELVEALLRAATRAGVEATKPLNDACKIALQPVMEAYKGLIPQVTGNLHRSVAIRNIKNQKSKGVGAAIAGPAHVKSGREWDVLTKSASNHAWLFEFGTGPRRPGTQGRRTLINTHEKVNGSFRRIGDSKSWVRNDEFDRAGRGVYFVMSSQREPRKKPFFLALRSGDTYGAMPAGHAMERAIQATRTRAQATLIEAIKQQVAKIQGSA